MGIESEKSYISESLCSKRPDKILLKREFHKDKGYREEHLTPAERYLEARLVPSLEQYRPSFKDFSYSKAEIERDQRQLQEKKNRLEKSYRRPKILEAMMFEMQQHDWFGEDAEIVLTSEFDDYLRGTDLVLEYERDGKVFRLAMDVSMCGGTERDIVGKRENIREGIEEGRLTSLKYFQSEKDSTKKGTIYEIPKVIIGMTTEDMQELSKTLVQKLKQEKGSSQELSQSPAQIKLLREIKKQLEEEIQYAEYYFKKNYRPYGQRIIGRHTAILEIIDSVLAEKENDPSIIKPLQRRMYRNLEEDWQGDIEYLRGKAAA